MAAKTQKSLFGEIAVAMRLLTREQLAECVVAQLRAPEARRLGDICLEKGLLSPQQIQRVVAYQQQLMARKGQAAAAGPEATAKPAPSAGAEAAAPPVAPKAATTPQRPPQREPAPTFDIEVEGVAALARELAQPAAMPRPAAGAPPRAEAEAPPLAPAAAPEPTAAAPLADLPPLDPAPEGAAPAARPRRPRNRPPQVDAMLRRMVEVGASDLHLVTGMPPLARIHGKMRRLIDRKALAHAELRELLFEIISDRAYEQFCRCNDADFAYAIEGVARFRANYFVDRKGIAAVFRFIPFDVLRPEQLGLPRKVLDLCQLTKGLVLVTGPTGSGKSTTLASLIDHINRTRDDHIITIEDPVEFTHENKKCLVNQREVGTHTESFKSALRAALREDPDIILVGELRDLETVSIALETAETGHLVFGTLHTTTAASTVDRIIDQFPPAQQAQIRVMLAGSLRGVVSQVLCAKRGGGRVAAYEILLGSPAVANLIREGKTPQITTVMQTSRSAGMQAMNDHLIDLVKAKAIEAEEAYFKAYDRTSLLQAFQSAEIAFKPPQA